MKTCVFVSLTCAAENVISLVVTTKEAGLDALPMGEHVALFDEMECPDPGSPDAVRQGRHELETFKAALSK